MKAGICVYGFGGVFVVGTKGCYYWVLFAREKPFVQEGGKCFKCRIREPDARVRLVGQQKTSPR